MSAGVGNQLGNFRRKIGPTEWMRRAKCKGERTSDFFYEWPANTFTKNSLEQREHIAKLSAICGACPVFEDCRKFVNTERIYDGYWAGETPSMRRKRWGRERKMEVA